MYNIICVRTNILLFINLKMPINVFGNSNSNNNGKKIDATLSVQKP